MSTLSNRLLMTLPRAEDFDSMAEGDNVLSDAYDKIDLNSHCRIVANKAAVTVPFEGQHIRSIADSKNYYRKNNNWAEFAAPALPGDQVIGFVGTSVFSSGAPVIMNTTGVWSHCLSLTFTSIATHTYLITASPSFVALSILGMDFFWNIRGIAGSSTTSSSPVLDEDYNFITFRTRPYARSIRAVIASSGLYTVSIYGRMETSGGRIDMPIDLTSRLTVYDMTPI